MNREIVMRSGE